MGLKQTRIKNQVVEVVWVKQNPPGTDREAIKRDLLTNLTCPNYQFTNLFQHFGDILGYSVQSELEVENENASPDSSYQTKITVKSYFAITEKVPFGTELVIPEKIINFFNRKDRNFKRLK